MKLILHRQLTFSYIIILIFFLSSCAINKQTKIKDQSANNNDLVVFFTKNKNYLNNKEEKKLLAFITNLTKEHSVVIRIWVAPSFNVNISSLNLTWIRLKKLDQLVSHFTDDIELFYDPNLEQDTALISVLWSN